LIVIKKSNNCRCAHPEPRFAGGGCKNH